MANDTLNYANDWWERKVKPVADRMDNAYPAFLFGFAAGMAYGVGIPTATRLGLTNELTEHAANQLH